jgi:hypothetical protein
MRRQGRSDAPAPHRLTITDPRENVHRRRGGRSHARRRRLQRRITPTAAPRWKICKCQRRPRARRDTAPADRVGSRSPRQFRRRAGHVGGWDRPATRSSAHRYDTRRAGVRPSRQQYNAHRLGEADGADPSAARNRSERGTGRGAAGLLRHRWQPLDACGGNLRPRAAHAHRNHYPPVELERAASCRTGACCVSTLLTFSLRPQTR